MIHVIKDWYRDCRIEETQCGSPETFFGKGVAFCRLFHFDNDRLRDWRRCIISSGSGSLHSDLHFIGAFFCLFLDDDLAIPEGQSLLGFLADGSGFVSDFPFGGFDSDRGVGSFLFLQCLCLECLVLRSDL